MTEPPTSPTSRPPIAPLDPLHHSVAEACMRCALSCEQCLTRAIEDGAAFAPLLRDAATYSQTCASMIARESEYGEYIASVCADICDRAADACEEQEEEWYHRCTELCRRCARECRTIAG